MTDRRDALGRRAGAQLRRRATGLDAPGEGLDGIRRRAARPPGRVTAAVAGLLALAVVGVAWLVRVDGAAPVDADRDGRTVLDAGADSGWESVGDDAFHHPEGLVSVTGVAVADGTVVAVGGDARNGREGMVGPGVWRSADGREWQAVAADRIDDGGHRFAGAAARMVDVTVVDDDGRSRLVAVGWAQSEEVRVPLAWISDDLGASWRQVEPEPVEGRLEAVAASPEGLVAVGSVQGEGGTSWVAVDGEDWERRSAAGLGETDLVTSVAAAGGRLAARAVGSGDEPLLWTSDDGRSWQPARLEDGPDGRLLLSRVVAGEDGGFLAVGTVEPVGEADPYGVILRSADGRTWRPAGGPVGVITGDGEQRVHDITEGDAGLVAVGVSDGDPVVWHARHGRGWEVTARGDHLLAGAGAEATAAMTRVDRVPAGLLAVGSVTDTSDRAERPVVWLHPAEDEPTGHTPPPDLTGMRLVASSDTRLTVADVDTTDAASIRLGELSGGDPTFRLVRRGDAIVFSGTGGDTYAVDPDDPDRARKVGDSTYFLPSAVEDRVWLVDGAAGTAAGNRLREVTVDGEESVGAREAPGGTTPTAAVPAGIVLSTEEGLAVWDPEADDVVARLPDGRFVAAGGSMLAWCQDPCASLRVTAIGADDTVLPEEIDERVLEAPGGAERWAGPRAAFSPDATHVAVPVTPAADPSAEPGADFGLAVVDVGSGEVRVPDEGSVQPGPFAWSPDGRWLFAPAAGGGVLIHDTERDRTEVRALDLGTVHGLAAVE